MAHIQLRIHHDDKKAAKEVLDKLGLTFSGAIKLFLKQLIRSQRLPFDISATDMNMVEGDQKGETPITETKPKVESKPKFSNMLESGFRAKKIG